MRPRSLLSDRRFENNRGSLAEQIASALEDFQFGALDIELTRAEMEWLDLKRDSRQ